MFTIVLYSITLVLLILSTYHDKGKTKKALKKAWKSFENILPQFLIIIILIGIILSILSPSMISAIIGKESGWRGIVLAAVIGSITLIPAFVAFPLAGALLHSGAGLMQIAVFVSTLMMVGIITIPMEINYFGKKATVLRNVFAFAFSFVVAILIGAVLQ